MPFRMEAGGGRARGSELQFDGEALGDLVATRHGRQEFFEGCRRKRFPIFVSGADDAFQASFERPAPHSPSASSGHELARVRRIPAQSRKPDRLAHVGCDCRMEGAAPNNAGRPAPLFRPGHRNRTDFARGVSIGASTERGLDRVDHENAGDRSAGSRSTRR